MDIDLTTSEKSTFLRFLLLFLSSSLILILFIAFLYYKNEKTLYIDLIKSNVQNIASKISNEVIISHMMNKNFEKEKYLNLDDYQISFYDKKQNKMFGNFEEKVDFSTKFLVSEKYIIFIDNSTVGHQGIDYIVIKDRSLGEKIDHLKISIIYIFLFIYIFICLVGFYLAKLFLKPIRDEREKLNNFIKDTTHELNTPISAIIMSIQDDNLSPKQIERIKLSANRISEIYKDLIYIFLEKKEKRKEIKQLELSSAIKEQIDNFEPLFLKKRIDVNIDIENTSFEIDKDDFIRLFNNLFSNAIKYNKISGKIDIFLKNRVLIIKDTGIGIKKEKLKDIYKRYYRATEQNGGFGLGLNIVNMICKTYNIKIEVESIENESTIFRLYF